MPHGKMARTSYSRYRKSTTAARSAAVAKARSTNTAVKKTRKSYRMAPKPVRNAKSISVLARQVRTLQLQRYGFLQYQRQGVTLISTRQGTGDGPSLSTPIAFPLNCFYDKTRLITGIVDPNAGSTSFQESVNASGQEIWWQKAQNQGVINLDAQYDWMQRTNKDTVDPTQYLPYKTTLNIKFELPMWANDQPQLYRVTVFKCKKMAVNNTDQLYHMPFQFGSYYGMAQKDPNYRRMFSKRFHTILLDKWVRMNPKANAISQYNRNASEAPYVVRNIRFTYQFKGRKPIRPDFDSTVQASDYGSRPFWNHIDQDEIIWCMISSSTSWQNPLAHGTIDPTTHATTPGPPGWQPIRINMTRLNVWRDAEGTWGGM